MKGLGLKMESAIVKSIKDHAHAMAGPHRANASLARQKASQAADDCCRSMSGSGLCHPMLIAGARRKVQRHINGKGFMDTLGKVWSYAKPFVAPILKAVTPMVADFVGKKSKFAGNLLSGASNLLQEQLEPGSTAPPPAAEGSGFLGMGRAPKRARGGFLGFGQKGSPEMKAKMARVRAARKGGALMVAGRGALSDGWNSTF